MPDHVLISRLRAGGIATPRVAVDEARRAGLPLPFACALLEKESAGGHNVFGHDASIFSGAGAVTREKYLAYKRLRGRTKMQGVGPVQLTWWELQDAADREGGCWRPEINMRVGFRHLAELIREHGESDGARRYNGSGDAAAAYSAELLTRARRWERILADVPAAASNGNGRHGAGRHAAEGHAHRGTDAHGHQSVSRAGGGDGHYGAGRRASDGPDGYRRASDRTTTDRSGRERRATDRPGGHAAQPPRDRAADLPGAAGGRAGAAAGPSRRAFVDGPARRPRRCRAPADQLPHVPRVPRRRPRALRRRDRARPDRLPARSPARGRRRPGPGERRGPRPRGAARQRGSCRRPRRQGRADGRAERRRARRADRLRRAAPRPPRCCKGQDRLRGTDDRAHQRDRLHSAPHRVPRRCPGAGVRLGAGHRFRGVARETQAPAAGERRRDLRRSGRVALDGPR